MNKLIDEIYAQGFSDRTIRALLMVIYDERPKESETIFKNIKQDEMATIKQKMKIVEPYLDKTLAKGCDGCPEEVVPDPTQMEKLVLPSDVKQQETQGEVMSQKVGAVLNRFGSDKEKMIEYARERGYNVRMNFSVLKLAQIIADNE